MDGEYGIYGKQTKSPLNVPYHCPNPETPCGTMGGQIEYSSMSPFPPHISLGFPVQAVEQEPLLTT